MRLESSFACSYSQNRRDFKKCGLLSISGDDHEAVKCLESAAKLLHVGVPIGVIANTVWAGLVGNELKLVGLFTSPFFDHGQLHAIVCIQVVPVCSFGRGPTLAM